VEVERIMLSIDEILFSSIKKFDLDDILSETVFNILEYYFLGELNNDLTRWRARFIIDDYLKDKRLYDYQVICDERNNSPDVIAAHQLNVDVFYKEHEWDLNFKTFRSGLGPCHEIPISFLSYP
jgi:hypothetical protein